MLIVGQGDYGRIDHVPGLFHVRTRFVHGFWFPLIPVESRLVLESVDATPSAIRMPLSFRSVLLAWIRGVFVLLALWLTASGLVFAAFGGGLADEDRFVAVAVLWGAAIGFWILYGLTYFWQKPRFDRALRLGALAAISPEQVERCWSGQPLD